jgi:hypothetical protein
VFRPFPVFRRFPVFRPFLVRPPFLVARPFLVRRPFLVVRILVFPLVRGFGGMPVGRRRSGRPFVDPTLVRWPIRRSHSGAAGVGRPVAGRRTAVQRVIALAINMCRHDGSFRSA